MSLLLRLKPQQKDYLKSISNSHIDTFFLIHFELKRRTHWYTTVVLRKSYPIPDQNGQNLDPFSDQNGVKVKPFGAAHTYMAGIWEYCTVLPGQKFLHGWLISEEFQKRVESRLNHLWGNIGRGPFKYESHGGRWCVRQGGTYLHGLRQWFRDLVHRLALVVSFLLKDMMRILNKHPSRSVDQ